MLQHLKQFFKSNQDDIILAIGVFLIAENIASLASNEENREEKYEGKFVASKSGKVYHWPWSYWGEKIKLENQVWFDSEEEAQSAGYKRASDFEKWVPVE